MFCIPRAPHRAVAAALALSAFSVLALSATTTAHAQVTENFIGLNNGNQLFRFSANTGSGASTAAIATTNLAGGAGTTSIYGLVGGSQFLQSIDFRPSNGLLYGLTTDQTSTPTLRLYTINTTSGAASLVSTLNASTGGASSTATPFAAAGIYTIDFNPQADALRIVNDAQGNYRISSINLNNGSGTTFTDLALTQGSIAGISYTNNIAGATSTRLFDVQPINGLNSNLYEQTPPNNGTLVAQPGTTGFSLFGDADVSGVTGFGYFAGTNFPNGSFYRFNDINTSAAATQVGTFSGVGSVIGFAAPIGVAAAAPEPGSIALLLMGGAPALVGGIMVRRKKLRAAA